MKFEDLLMQPSEDKQKRRIELAEEVEQLQAELDGELKLNSVLQCAAQGPLYFSPSCLSSLLPHKVQALLTELAMAEKEICWLERKVDELKLNLNKNKQQTREWEMLQDELSEPKRKQRQQKHLLCRHLNQTEAADYELFSRSLNYEHRKYKFLRERRASFSSSAELQTLSPRRSNETDKTTVNPRCTRRSRYIGNLDEEAGIDKPNKLSEELIKCLISIFLTMHEDLHDTKGPSIVPKHSLSCMNSKGFMSKSSFSCTGPTFPLDDCASDLDPYSISPDTDNTLRDDGPNTKFIQITRTSLKARHVSECFPSMEKLRVLMHKLGNVDLTYLNYKQKLAFWINTYNACIMHAFLQHGLPSTQEKLLALMNKAAINVGGIVLNALAIEHFILRHPSDSKHDATDEKEMLLRHAYGLRYPEPNVTFALCRGSWSSPVLRVYTPDEVANELGRAKVEYLEATVGITSKKKIAVPKLLQWHMRDFADDMESLLEWIYSQLQHSGSVKRLIMEYLNSETKTGLAKLVEIQPYVSEFRYLLPL